MDNGAYLKEMGRKIKSARLQNKISLPKLSAMCSTDMSNLWFVEQGERNVHILTLKSIADALKIDVKELL